MMLRPDFTVPVARLHMAGGAPGATGALRLCGQVFRRQEAGSSQPREYLQAGLEMFGGQDAAAARRRGVGAVPGRAGAAPVEIVTGDIGLVLAAIDALGTGPGRRAALRRHVWRPAGSMRCSTVTGGAGRAATRRAALLAAEAEGRVPELSPPPGRWSGCATPRTIAARVARLAAEAATPPLGSRRGGADREAVLARPRQFGLGAGQLRDIVRGMAGAATRRSTGSRPGSTRSRPAASTSSGWTSRRASGAPRSNTTTASSSASSPPAGPTCRPSPAAGATTR